MQLVFIDVIAMIGLLFVLPEEFIKIVFRDKSFWLNPEIKNEFTTAKEEHSTGATTNLIAKKILCATMVQEKKCDSDLERSNVFSI